MAVTPATPNRTLPISPVGTYIAYVFYVLVIVFGIFIAITDPSQLAPILIQIAGGLLVLFGVVEIIVTYSNRKQS